MVRGSPSSTAPDRYVRVLSITKKNRSSAKGRQKSGFFMRSEQACCASLTLYPRDDPKEILSMPPHAILLTVTAKVVYSKIALTTYTFFAV